MKDESIKDNISTEVLAAFLDGNATAQESQEIIESLSADAGLRELMHISQSVDAELGLLAQECEFIPMTSLAASCEESYLCCLECEKYILCKRGVDFDEQQLLQNAVQKGWLKEKGTALHNIGRHLESAGLVVDRQYKASISDIEEALGRGDDVIVAVDCGELLNNGLEELREDLFFGQIPNHAVVVLACDKSKQTITLYDPNTSHAEDIYSLEQFMDAWNDSRNYLLTINYKGMKTYIPKPIDVSDVKLTDDLTELREAIAENAHEIWAIDRQAEGWTYGPKRDENKKETPCMVPYSQLPEKEKEYDRKMAMKTLKLVRKMGYDLVKREETELYKDLLKRIRDAKETYYCSVCWSKGIKTPVAKHQVFCHVCGCNLKLEGLYKD